MSNVHEAHREDLELARACAAGERSAREAFERDHLGAVAEHAALVDRSPEFAQRVRTALAAELFRAGRIQEYTGDAPLAAWIRIAALRTALALQRAATPSASTAVGTDEVRLTRESDEAAVAVALHDLPVRDRLLLRLLRVENMDSGAVGAIYGVPTSTVTRWVTEIRQRIRNRAPATAAEVVDALVLRLLRND
jgi:RNA polymerase sigma-70 factor (ECF subfamily)